MSAAALPPDLEHRFADVNGIRMHYVEAGQGPLVLFLHGFPEFWYSWRHQLAALAPDHRVVAPDLRGYNETESLGPYDTDTLQQDVLALIDHLGGGPVHLVAHDWGGAIGWLVANLHPEALKTYTACNIPHPAIFQRASRRNPRQMMRSWYMAFFQIPWLPERAVAASDYHRLAKGLIRDCRPGTFTKDDIRMFLEAWRRQGLGGGINWYRGILRSPRPLPDPLPAITVPTRLIWGEDDRALGKELTDGTAELFADAGLYDAHFLPGISHWVQQEAPAEVNALIREHIGRYERQ